MFVAGEENSRVQAHIDEHEFSAHILTDEAEYNIEVNMVLLVQHNMKQTTGHFNVSDGQKNFRASNVVTMFFL